MPKGNPIYIDGVKSRDHPLYGTWKNMRQRCRDVNHKDYKHYGALGVKVCLRWSSFSNFVYDVGERPADHTLDRIDPYGDYTPNNCEWATLSKQNSNQRVRGLINLKGVTQDKHGGYIVRRRIDGVRKYLGYVWTEQAAEDLYNAHG